MTGTYTGDGTANRILDIGFTPKALWIYPVAPPPPMTNTSPASAMETKFSNFWNGGTTWTGNPAYFQGIVPNGFKTGTDASGNGTNVNTVDYFWIAF